MNQPTFSKASINMVSKGNATTGTTTLFPPGGFGC